MRLRTKLFLTWAGIMPLLWVWALWSTHRTVRARFDQMAQESFDGTKQGLKAIQKERLARMRQAGRLVMSIPDLRALIAEQSSELSAENLASLQERLDNLEEVVGVSFVAVLNRDRHFIAQSHAAPWKTLSRLNEYRAASPQPAALLDRLFARGDDPAKIGEGITRYGLWSYGGHLHEVVGIPLVFDSENAAAPEGALIMGVALSDESAAELGKSHNCQVSFFADGTVVASSLPADTRQDLLNFYRTASAAPAPTFIFNSAGTTYRCSDEPLQDPCSGAIIGHMLIQRDMQDAQVQSQMLHSLMFIMVSGLLAAAVISYFISAAIMRPVQRLVTGVRRVAGGDLELALPVKGRDELTQLSISFNDMVSQLRSRRDLEKQVDKAETASRAKSQFLANMSHEIRTPLNGVVGMTQLLLGTPLTEQQRRYGALVKSSAELLTTLINDILDFSKIEAGKLEIEAIDFNLHSTVEEVIDLLSEKATRKKLELGCCFERDIPKHVRGDPDRLRQILVNLVNNAIKFTHSGSVVVRVMPHSTCGRDVVVRFSITDTGIGIPADRLDRLFKPFSQVDSSTTRKFGGTGLGLVISRQLAELMGGTMGVESEPNRGSTFWFTIKLATIAENPQPAPALDPRGFKVLAVDDSQTTRALLQEQLSSWDLHAQTAGSAAEALGALRTAAGDGQAFKVAIVDSDMPGTSGFELARAIKSDPQLRQTALLVLLSMETPVDRPALGAAGFAGHMIKPVRQSQLFDALMRAIARESAGLIPDQFVEDHPTPAPAPSKHRRVLIAEDNEVNQIVAIEFLSQAGFECQIVADGKQAVEACFNTPCDLILMDCQMPEMDGFEATRIIRQKEQIDGQKRHIPIIALTANAIKGDREDCLRAGMDGYCSKPIDPKQLLATIDSLLEKSAPAVPPEPIQNTPIQSSPVPATALAPSNLLPPIAVETLMDRCLNNLAMIQSVLGKFEKQMERDVDRIHKSLAEKDTTAIARTAHMLKGTAGTVAAEDLARFAAEIERLGRQQQLDGMDQQLERIRDEVKRCTEYLPQVLELASAKLSAPPTAKEGDPCTY